jgi:hypothetical protein
MQEPSRYVIKARLTTDRNGKTSEEHLEFTHLVNCLRDIGVGASFYDPDLKIHVEDNSRLASVFQIDILSLEPLERAIAEQTARIEKLTEAKRQDKYTIDDKENVMQQSPGETDSIVLHTWQTKVIKLCN